MKKRIKIKDELSSSICTSCDKYLVKEQYCRFVQLYPSFGRFRTCRSYTEKQPTPKFSIKRKFNNIIVNIKTLFMCTAHFLFTFKWDWHDIKRFVKKEDTPVIYYWF